MPLCQLLSPLLTLLPHAELSVVYSHSSKACRQKHLVPSNKLTSAPPAASSAEFKNKSSKDVFCLTKWQQAPTELTQNLLSSRKWFSKGFPATIIICQVISQHERQGRCFPGNSNHGKALTSAFLSLPTARKRTADAWALPSAGPQAPRAVSNLVAPGSEAGRNFNSSLSFSQTPDISAMLCWTRNASLQRVPLDTAVLLRGQPNTTTHR